MYMVNIMKKTTKIYLYNLATVFFALATLMSIGGWGRLPAQTVLTNIALFATLTYNCSKAEDNLRKSLKRKHKKPRLTVHRGKTMRPAA